MAMIKRGYILLVAAVAAASVSCTKDLIEKDHSGGIDVIISAGGTATKTELIGSSVYWSDGDAIGVTDGISTNYRFCENSIEEGATARKATFTGTVAVAGQFYAYYPYSDLGVTTNLATVSIPAIQYPGAATFDGKADVLVSKPFQVTNTNPTVDDLIFRRLTSIVKLVIADKTTKSVFGTEKVLSASITADAPLVGDARINLANAEMESLYDNSSTKVTARYTEGIMLNENGVYLNVYPQTLASGSSFKVSLETTSYSIVKSIKLPKDVVLSSGNIGTITMSVSDAELIQVPAITFADKAVEELCLENWDVNGDGKLSYEEAAAITDLGNVFKSNTSITSFAELQYFTGLKSIGIQAFQGCTSLASITFPANLETIGDAAFNGCTGLQEIEIPKSVTTIGKYAFYNCTGLTGIFCWNPAPVSLGNKMFDGSSCLIYVPTESISSYKEAWPSYASRISDIADTAIHFVDALVKEICIKNWDTNKDGELSYREAAAVKGLYSNGTSGTTIMAHKNITSFNELQYFTGLTTIGTYAFINCTSLTTITLPSGVTSIGLEAFRNCTSLTEIMIPESVTSIGDSAFYGCTSLTGITIPESVTSIGYYAFRDCTSLTGITIPESVTSIGYSAFRDCTSLTTITLPSGVTGIVLEAFMNCTSLTGITIPEGVTSIGGSAFMNCTSLTGITIPNSVTSIGGSAFKNCTSLTALTFPITVCPLTSIGDSAFYGCTSLTEVRIPNSVTSIGAYAFAECTGLTSCSISGMPSFSIGDHAFYNCKNLSKGHIWNYATSIGEEAFYGCAIGGVDNEMDNIKVGPRAFYDCHNLGSANFYGSGGDISSEAFMGCKSLRYVYLNGIQTIGESAFKSCDDLWTVDLGSQLTSIGEEAFRGCGSKFQKVIIPESVTSIGSYAFASSYLKEVRCLSVAPPAIGEGPFPTRKDLLIYVPEESLFDYQIEWPQYESQLQALSD